MLANNPSKLAWQEVRELFPGRPIGCFLSLGTGILDVVKVKGHLVDIGIACQNLAKNCEAVAGEMGARFRMESEKNGTKSPYFRFSVDRGLENIKLDEWAQGGQLTAVTSGYMSFQDQVMAVKGFVNALKHKAEWIMAREELI